MIRLIALHGKLSGSAVLNSTGGRTEFTLKMRRGTSLGADGSLCAFLAAPDANGGLRLERAEIANGAGSANIDGVRGIFITSGNAIVAEGISGISEEQLERARVRLRLGFSASQGGAAEPPSADGRGEVTAPIGSNGKAEAPQKPEAAQSEPNEPNELSSSASPVTRRILSQAKALFGSGDADDYLFDDSPASANAPQSEALPEVEPYTPDSEAVKNPFPALFPNSSWRKKAGEAALSGKVKHRGRLYSVAAVPREGRFPPNELSPFSNIRRARGEDGKMYWLGIKRI